jgi:hypothetical protein
MKDPGFAVDLTLRGNIRDYVEVYLGHTKWRDVAGTALHFDGDLQIARAFPDWLRFETVNRARGLSTREAARESTREASEDWQGRALSQAKGLTSLPPWRPRER